MDRKLIYPGAIPQEADVLAPQRYAVEGLGWLAFSIFGSTTTVEGMLVTASSPAALSVQVNPGAVYAPLALDANSFSTLAADSHTIMQQGILRDALTLTITPPTTAGQSRVYVVQAACQVVDADAGVLPYYNAADPTTALTGPGGAGTPQNTRRAAQAVISLKAGTAAATGSQTAPAPDAGYVELARVTVANGATTITSGNITVNAALRRPISTLPDMVAAIRAVTPTAINIQDFVSSSNYTPHAKMVYVTIEAVGGGGGSGAATGGANGSAVGGAGAGGYTKRTLSRAQLLAINSSFAITVGAGGTAGASIGAGGGNGGSTLVAGLLTANGGFGSPFAGNGVAGVGAIGGAAGGGDDNRPGQAGGLGFIFGNIGIGGEGGASTFGFGGPASQPTSPTGAGGVGYGSGAGGAGAADSWRGGAQGAQGRVLITEYIGS